MRVRVSTFYGKRNTVQRGGWWFPQADGHWSRDAVPGIAVQLASVSGKFLLLSMEETEQVISQKMIFSAVTWYPY